MWRGCSVGGLSGWGVVVAAIGNGCVGYGGVGVGCEVSKGGRMICLDV